MGPAAGSVDHVVQALADQEMITPSESVNYVTQMHRKVIKDKTEVTW